MPDVGIRPKEACPITLMDNNNVEAKSIKYISYKKKAYRSAKNNRYLKRVYVKS